MSSRRDPYNGSKPDFADLARKSAKLGSLAIKTLQNGRSEYAQIDFKDIKSSIALTEAILEHDFGIHCRLRDDRLCPPIPARLSYLQWVEEILNQTMASASSIFGAEASEAGSEDMGDGQRPIKRIKRDDHKSATRILDVGTGASCIYPILGCALSEEWYFIGTDIDSVSLEAAQAILDDPSNNDHVSKARFTSGKQLRLKDRIHLLLREAEDSLLMTEEDVKGRKLLPLLVWPNIKKGLLYHAVMCNPPFYESVEDMQRSFDLKEDEPNAVCLGNKNEIFCTGGEVAFIQRMITESREIGDRVLWFTSLIGLRRSLENLAKIFKDAGITNVYFSPLQSGLTTRYVVAWSFTPYRLPLTAVINNQSVKSAVQENAVLTRQIPISIDQEQIDSFMMNLIQVLDEKHIRWTRPQTHELIILPIYKTWSRQGRRALKQGLTVDQSREPIVGIRLTLSMRGVTNHWIYGHDRSIFFSFVDEVLKEVISRRSK